MKNISFKALLAGGAMSFLTTGLLSMFLLAYFTPVKQILGGAMGQGGEPSAKRFDGLESANELNELISSTSIHFDPVPVLTAGVLGVFACAVFSGYVAAKVARRAQILNGALSAWACIAASIYLTASGLRSVSPIDQAIELSTLAAFFMLGGYIRLFQLNNAQHEADLPPQATTRQRSTRDTRLK